MVKGKKIRSIHGYFTKEEYEGVLKFIQDMRVLGKHGATLNKGDITAAIFLVAKDDTEFIARVRKYLMEG